MTANRNFKRLVRARARKTGESYAAALRHFERRDAEERPMADPALRRVEKPEYGFAVSVPEEWRELSPDARNSPWEVARFSGPRPGGGVGICLVFRNPKAPNADAHAFAEGVQPGLEHSGFGNFRLMDAVVAGRPGARLDFDRPSPNGGIWAVRHYFLVVGDVPFCVSFGTTAPDEDRGLLDALIARFELLGDLATAPTNQRARRERRTVAKPEYGLAFDLPPGWEERPPDHKRSPWEVTRLVEPGDARHSGTVSRRPRPDADARRLAEEHQDSLRRQGFGDFGLTETTLDGRPCVRLDAAITDAGRVWATRGYHVVSEGISFSLDLGTVMPAEDADLFDSIAASFRLLPGD
jgi:hypothetical protein